MLSEQAEPGHITTAMSSGGGVGGGKGKGRPASSSSSSRSNLEEKKERPRSRSPHRKTSAEKKSSSSSHKGKEKKEKKKEYRRREGSSSSNNSSSDRSRDSQKGSFYNRPHSSYKYSQDMFGEEDSQEQTPPETTGPAAVAEAEDESHSSSPYIPTVDVRNTDDMEESIDIDLSKPPPTPRSPCYA